MRTAIICAVIFGVTFGVTFAATYAAIQDSLVPWLGSACDAVTIPVSVAAPG